MQKRTIQIRCGSMVYTALTTDPARYLPQARSDLKAGRFHNVRLQRAFDAHPHLEVVSELDSRPSGTEANIRSVSEKRSHPHRSHRNWTINRSEAFLTRFNVLHQMYGVGLSPITSALWRDAPTDIPGPDSDSVFYRWRRIWNHLSPDDIKAFFSASVLALQGLGPTPKAEMVVYGLLSFPEDEIAPVSDLGTLSLAVATVLGESDEFQTALSAWCLRNRDDVYHALDRVVLS